MQIKYLKTLFDAERHLKIAEYFLEVTLKITNDNRILSKSLIEMQKAATHLIETILYFEAERKTIIPHGKEERANLFFNKKKHATISFAEVEEIKKILIFTKKHNESSLEFVRKEKLVIFDAKECKIITEKGLKESIEILNNIILRLHQKTCARS